MIVYLSGPVTFIGVDAAKAAFRDADAALREAYDRIETYIPTDYVDEHATHEDAMRTCIRDLVNPCSYDALVLLPLWELSKGCRVERAVAQAIGIPVVTLQYALKGGIR